MAKKKTIAPLATLTLNLTQEHFDSFLDLAVTDLIDWNETERDDDEDESLKKQLGITKDDLKANPAMLSLFTKLAQEFFDAHMSSFDGQDVADTEGVRKLYAKEIKAWEKGVKARAEAAEKASKAEAERIAKEGVQITLKPENLDRAVTILRAAGLLEGRTLHPAQAWPFPKG